MVVNDNDRAVHVYGPNNMLFRDGKFLVFTKTERLSCL